MYRFEKRLMFPINIKKKDLNLVKVIVKECGGPYGELGNVLRYYNQCYIMPDAKGKALLSDIANEEVSHIEMMNALLYQLMKDASLEELKEAGLEHHFSKHGKQMFHKEFKGLPFSQSDICTSGNYLEDLKMNIEAEKKAKETYEHLIDLTKDPNVIHPLLYLRQREKVHKELFEDLYNMYKAENL